MIVYEECVLTQPPAWNFGEAGLAFLAAAGFAGHLFAISWHLGASLAMGWYGAAAMVRCFLCVLSAFRYRVVSAMVYLGMLGHFMLRDS